MSVIRLSFWVFRWDDNPENVTFQTWCRMCGPFDTHAAASAFIDRAESLRQRLRIVPEFGRKAE
jgi:hypothetical protein